MGGSVSTGALSESISESIPGVQTTLSPGCGIGSSGTGGTSMRSPRILLRMRLWRFRILTGR